MADKSRFPNPRLVTQDGERVRLYDDLVKDRIVMVHFAYTRCTGSCPRSTANLVQVQRLLGERFGRDVHMLTLSLDPANDTPEAMKLHMDALGGRPGWTWLTGARRDLEVVRRFLGFYDPDPRIDADRSQHAGTVLVGNERRGRWSTVPAMIRPQAIVDLVLRTAGVAWTAQGAEARPAMPPPARDGGRGHTIRPARELELASAWARHDR